MARHVIVGNGGLTVGLDEKGLVHDFYYPYVGLENLTNARSNPHYIGVWVDGTFSWLNDDGWETRVDFNENTLVSEIVHKNKSLQLELHCNDFVDATQDVFARNIRVSNLDNRKREIRLFFHQVFQISANGRADTVMYVPGGHYILDYKGHCSILAYAETESGQAFDQYAVGNSGIEGKEGTFRDAEDGELSMSAVEHASVDSTLRVSLTIASKDDEQVHYWLAVADTQTSLEVLHNLYLGHGFDIRHKATVRHWQDWMDISEPKLRHLSQEHRTATKKSLLVMKAHIDKHGGVIASCDSSIYNYGRDYYSYVWPRDGAYVMWPLIKLGYTEEPKQFFRFCNVIMHQDGYMLHKYQPDQAIGSTWHPLIHGKREELAIQEDETASVVFMLGEYAKYSGDYDFADSLYESMVKPMANFMCGFIDEQTSLPHASYDLWEEKFLTNTYTVANTYAALLVAVAFASRHNEIEEEVKWQACADMLNANAEKLFDSKAGHYVKGFLLQKDGSLEVDTTLDVSSFFAVATFNYGSLDYRDATLQKIEEVLLDVSPSGGSPRYEHDAYFRSEPAYMGNPWFVTTLWLSQYYAKVGDRDKAQKYIDWALGNSLYSGLLSEQIDPQNSTIIGVTPLVWSHAELINAILAI